MTADRNCASCGGLGCDGGGRMPCRDCGKVPSKVRTDSSGRPIVSTPVDRPTFGQLVRRNLLMRETLLLLAEADTANAELIRDRHVELRAALDDTNGGEPAR